jgi:hypothetical protein
VEDAGDIGRRAAQDPEATVALEAHHARLGQAQQPLAHGRARHLELLGELVDRVQLAGSKDPGADRLAQLVDDPVGQAGRGG